MTNEVQITFDCADPAGLAAFWVEVIGYQPQPPPDGFDSWDKRMSALETEANRLEAIGATRAYRVEPNK